MSDDDFLWSCDSSHQRPTSFDAQDDVSVWAPIRLLHHCTDENKGHIDVLESHGSGVFDSIGGELWQASLLLCAHIILHRDDFKYTHIMELGSGVGLPGLLLSNLHRQLNSVITLTDYETFILKNLRDTLFHQFDVTQIVDDDDGEATLGHVRLCMLDWTIFADTCGVQQAVPAEVDNSRCDVLVGSALCYTTDHVCLADLVK
jgi:hypothetical protein